MNFLLVEDDPFHAKVIEEAVKKKFGRQVNMTVVGCEKDCLKAVTKGPWGVVILDQMMPWATEEDPDPFTGAPAAGALSAGTRCYEQLLRATSEMSPPAIVFFTNLEQQHVPEGVAYVRKKADPKLTTLLEAISRLLKGS